jgi:hypothetical protein
MFIVTNNYFNMSRDIDLDGYFKTIETTINAFFDQSQENAPSGDKRFVAEHIAYQKEEAIRLAKQFVTKHTPHGVSNGVWIDASLTIDLGDPLNGRNSATLVITAKANPVNTDIALTFSSSIVQNPRRVGFRV